MNLQNVKSDSVNSIVPIWNIIAQAMEIEKNDQTVIPQIQEKEGGRIDFYSSLLDHHCDDSQQIFAEGRYYSQASWSAEVFISDQTGNLTEVWMFTCAKDQEVNIQKFVAYQSNSLKTRNQ